MGHALRENSKNKSTICDIHIHAIKSMGNPFLNTAKELVVLDTHDCMDGEVVEALYRM